MMKFEDCRFNTCYGCPLCDICYKFEETNKQILKQKAMKKITDFKEGDLIVRIKESETYSSEPKYLGDPFIFCEIKYGKIYLIHFHRCKNKKIANIEEYEIANIEDSQPVDFEEYLELRGNDEWEYYFPPKILEYGLNNLLYGLYENEISKDSFHKAKLYKKALSQLSKYKNDFAKIEKA